MKTIKSTLALAVGLGILPLTGWSYAFQSSAAFATWTDGSYTVANDVWGSNPGPETIWANSGSNWGIFSNQTGNGIKSYPHVEYDNINTPVNSLGTITSSFNASTPSGSNYDQSYDIWLNGNQYEVMIWASWKNNNPIAKSYNANGTPNATYSNVTIDGITYNVYTGTGGSGACMSFLRTSQTSSGTVIISDVLKWINTTGWYNNPTLSGIQCGWEILDTSGQQTFTMNSYSVTITSGGGGGSGGNLISNGTYTIVGQNSGMALDDPGSSTANGTKMEQWTVNGGSNQKWQLTNEGNNVVELVNVASAKALDVPNNSTTAGTDIDQWSLSGGNNQRWTVVSKGSGYYELVNVNSGMALDVTGASKTAGALIDQWNVSGNSNQLWKFQ
jgi:hypothetical protein